MRNEPNLKAEQYRDHFMSRGAVNVNAGLFRVKNLTVVVGQGGGWEHVSVSHPQRTPSWEEMCMIKDLFFKDDEVVMQLHPAKKDYVNIHERVLHMWRPMTVEENQKNKEDYLKEREKMSDEDKAKYDVIELVDAPLPIPLPPKFMV